MTTGTALAEVSRTTRRDHEQLQGRHAEVGGPGIAWHKANGNWVVRHKVKGVEQFLGSFDDLEDAKRVKAQAMLLREPKPRRHDDSTAEHSDAFIAEQFALDDEGDAVWRKRPLTGDMAKMRENAR